jgi:site-specific DNA-methyltransferase (adenine-specific)
MNGTLYVGNNIDHLRSIPSNSIGAIVTDPPYGLGKEPDPRDVVRGWLINDEFKAGGSGYLGNDWDAFVPSPVVWMECYRILKPGGYMVAFAGSRTYDWLCLGIRFAGFGIKDSLHWIYSSGFPKSRNIGASIDALAGVEREITGVHAAAHMGNKLSNTIDSLHGRDLGSEKVKYRRDNPATKAAKEWDGYGTQLKPSHEPAVLAQKPISEDTIAENVLRWGVGALNLGACDVAGKWPPNILVDGRASVSMTAAAGDPSNAFPVFDHDLDDWAYMYCPKPSVREREEGLGKLNAHLDRSGKINIHPTVKPIKLMRWLVKLCTPHGQTVLDPYLGSGTTAIAAELEGRRWVGMELSTDYATVAWHRIDHYSELAAVAPLKKKKVPVIRARGSAQSISLKKEVDDEQQD